MRISERYRRRRRSEGGIPQPVLGEGVSRIEWEREKVVTQNPRIRAFLGCIKLLEGGFESNFAVLHCSPERLLEIWAIVRQVMALMRGDLQRLLEAPSCEPDLEEARRGALEALQSVFHEVFEPLDKFGEEVERDSKDLRKLLCISLGQLYGFLQDTFLQIVSADPRSRHDADYFLSKQFSHDIYEAEWLYSSLLNVMEFVERADHMRSRVLADFVGRLKKEGHVPAPGTWEETKSFVEMLNGRLVPRLKYLIGLPGIRLSEMESLNAYESAIPMHCQALFAVSDLGRAVTDELKDTPGPSRKEKEQCVRDLLVCHEVFSRELIRVASLLDRQLKDLAVFLPLWREGLERRRALLLADDPESGTQGPSGEPGLASP